MIVTFNNYGHGTACPVQQTLQAHTWLGQLVEIVEIDIKDGVHSISFGQVWVRRFPVKKIPYSKNGL